MPPTAGVFDSQSVKTTEGGGVRGYDAGKRVKGRKRHLVTDTRGLLVAVVVHSTGVRSRDGAPTALAASPRPFRRLRHIFADGAHAGDKLDGAPREMGRRSLEIIKRPE